MHNVRTFTVYPVIPDLLKPLLDIARNLWWCWNDEALNLFRRIDPDLWVEASQKPRLLLKQVSQLRLNELAGDGDFLAHLKRVQENLENYCNGETWFSKSNHGKQEKCLAYFSAEFGIHESLPIYSGGLGILAGDHLKAASDLGLPLIGVGLFYRLGYFHQHLDKHGRQHENYVENLIDEMPLLPVTTDNGEQLVVEVEFPGRPVKVKVWQVQVGRIRLFLLDSDTIANSEEDRGITANLYGGDDETRVQQEMLLGIGGVRALKAMNIEPDCYHMNEGHSAFLGLERVRNLMTEKGLTQQEAIAASRAATLFTTHTPVPAGNDVFSPGLLHHYFSAYTAELGFSWEEFLQLGRTDPHDQSEHFCMTVLALKLASYRNGVSQLHGAVSRNMWKTVWKNTPEDEVPIGSITNGIHTPTWISPELNQLLAKTLGTEWLVPPVDHGSLDGLDSIPDESIWEVHRQAKKRLAHHVRRYLIRQGNLRGEAPEIAEKAANAFDPEALTIGFARRFASYKRGNLIFKNMERITRILTQPGQRVQLLFAGKAHPRNEQGKEFIQEIATVANRAELQFSVIFLEDYNMDIARTMVQGVDVWLNNPRRPLEASGTSGMKVAANGGPNLSILDGWWCEGYRPDRGWAIGCGETWDDQEYQDSQDATAIYDLLENEVIPEYYQRNEQGIPLAWVARMKANLAGTLPEFDTGRMVKEYAETYYFPAAIMGHAMLDDDAFLAKQEASWLDKIVGCWENVAIDKIESDTTSELTVGSNMKVSATLHLTQMEAHEVAVELYHGSLNGHNQIEDPKTNPMRFTGSANPGTFTFEGEIPCLDTGQRGYMLRVRPRTANGDIHHDSGLVKWG